MTIDTKDLGSRAGRGQFPSLSSAEYLPHMRCPRCGSSLLLDHERRVWCTFVGGNSEPACAYGIDAPVSLAHSPAPVVPSNLEDKGRARCDDLLKAMEDALTVSAHEMEQALQVAGAGFHLCGENMEGLRRAIKMIEATGLSSPRSEASGSSESARLKAIEDCAKVVKRIADELLLHFMARVAEENQHISLERFADVADDMMEEIRALSDTPPRSGDA